MLFFFVQQKGRGRLFQIAHIWPGTPADRSGELRVGDFILEVRTTQDLERDVIGL